MQVMRSKAPSGLHVESEASIRFNCLELCAANTPTKSNHATLRLHHRATSLSGCMSRMKPISNCSKVMSMYGPITSKTALMTRLNAFPGTDAQRKAMHVKPAKKPNPFAPTIQKVNEIVPNKFVAKLKPASAAIRPAVS